MAEVILTLIRGEGKKFPLTFNDQSGNRLDFTGSIFSFAIDIMDESGVIQSTIEQESVAVSQHEKGKIELLFERAFVDTLPLGVHGLRIKSDIGARTQHNDRYTIASDLVSVVDG
ncbi:hypothetical protein SAMN02745753_03737 [Marinomonas polaris DSM 16579]|uniref:Uncharacterized protein n=1 Tax=Marinomonas polaris DSM 16579 TaxID=1122206 RepID=A0A1M5J1N0_9GAMM|nr:hypothetical protein [Marinomonas polaris]SHG34275.1 hypothetical protein SAMN02745753_03737 [Marinomonas polaris DSM 16579]